MPGVIHNRRDIPCRLAGKPNPKVPGTVDPSALELFGRRVTAAAAEWR